MRTYETVFILNPTIAVEEQEKHIEFYKENIVSNGGEILKVDVWGKQQLAYPIQNHTDGIYVVIQFKAATNYTNNELEKRYQFNEDVIRYIVVMLDEKRFKQNPRKEPVRKERPARTEKANDESVEDVVENSEAAETVEEK